MKISDVIRSKGSLVLNIAPNQTVGHLVQVLTENNIGAAVVSEDGRHVIGIVSERDIIRGLGKWGADVLSRPVSDVMTKRVHFCDPDDSIEETAHTMTYERIRHLPVVVNDELRAIVSIGDVVKYRIDQLTDERNHLLGYLHT